MKKADSEKERLKDNLKQSVRNCKVLKVGGRKLDSFFTITIHSFVDFTEEKYEDGTHSFKIDTTIKIENKRGESIEERSDIHFDARIEGTKVEIVNGIIFTDKDFIPYIFNLDS